MGTTLRLPNLDGSLEPYTPRPATTFPRPSAPLRSRVALAAVHVVVDPLADRARIDWEATLAFRRHVWSWGLGIAEAMDTAQRGMGLGWPEARELIERTVRESQGRRVVCGAGTDHLAPGAARSLDDVVAAYEQQCSAVEAVGGEVVLMASRELARLARGPDDYASVYGRVLEQLRRPALIHWLGPMFDPALAGYWGGDDPHDAMAACVELIAAHAARVTGVKVSMLDARLEVEMRRRLPEGVRMYTGDDFNFAQLMRGDELGHSDGLLGIFDGIAPAASAALQAMDAGDLGRYEALLAPTVPLSRHIFRAPTYHYKAGLVFLAFLNGRQRHFRMLGGLESARSVPHLAELFRLADRAGLLEDPELAASRMRAVLALAGVD
ncbi:MAG TPA: dihydrodipicolinate synthase family protein [Candidatus Dormibacteraeota bacterium]|nr:dihydrodipicolinate synthase family protein [Candidatus Dormibacteraeota bacterium]